MKAIKIISLFLISYMLNQFVNAQSCPAGKVWTCRYCGSNGLPDCKCIEEKNVLKWQKNVHPCRLQIALVNDTSVESYVFEDCSHLILNRNQNTLLWSKEDNSDKIIKNKDISLKRIVGCRCNEVGYGCAGWPPDFKCRSHCAKFCSKYLNIITESNKNIQAIIAAN
jgi:hypothetical protein